MPIRNLPWFTEALTITFSCRHLRDSWDGIMRSLSKVETIIIGAGPIGLEMGVALKNQGREFAIIDEHQVGHTISWYAPGTHFFSSPERISIAGVPLITRDQGKATREEYLDYLMGVAWQFDLPIYTGLRLVGLSRAGNLPDSQHERESIDADDRPIQVSGHKPNSDFQWCLSLRPNAACTKEGEPAEEVVRCNYLILAPGDMHAPRFLGIPGENQKNVSHYLKELRNYFRQEVVIVGGRNSAVEAAIRIYRMGGKVSILYRGESLDATSIKYWLYPEITSLIKNGLIRFINQSEPVSISGNRLFYRRKGKNGQDRKGDESNYKEGDERPESRRSSQGESNNGKGEERAKTTRSSPEENADAQSLEEFLEADQFLLLTGYVPNSSLYENLGINLVGDHRKPWHNEETMETNLRNVFVAGTATAGRQQRHTVFIENSHEHVRRISETIAHRSAGKSVEQQGNSAGSDLQGLYEEHPES